MSQQKEDGNRLGHSHWNFTKHSKMLYFFPSSWLHSAPAECNHGGFVPSTNLSQHVERQNLFLRILKFNFGSFFVTNIKGITVFNLCSFVQKLAGEIVLPFPKLAWTGNSSRKGKKGGRCTFGQWLSFHVFAFI